MTAFNDNNLRDQEETLRTNRRNDQANADQLVENTGSSAMEAQNPFTEAENPQSENQQSQSEDDRFIEEQFGENSGVVPSAILSRNSVSPGPDDDDLTDDDDDDTLDFDDDDDDTLIPIEGDDDDALETDDEDDIVGGTDMDDDDIVDDDEDDTTGENNVNRSTTAGMGANVSTRDHGRDTGRMTDHEPGITDI